MLTLVMSRHCVNGRTIGRHLHEALTALGWKPLYGIVDLEALPPTDPRLGYPSPTVLWGGKDIFGLPELPAPYPAAT